MLKKVLAFAMFGLFSFSLAALGSWYVINSENGLMMNTQAPTQEDEEKSQLTKKSQASQPSELPVAVQAKPMTAEEIFRFGATIRSRQESLKKREGELLNKEKQLNLIQDDIQQEKRELDGMIDDARNAIASGQELLSKVVRENEQLENRRKEIESEMQRRDSIRREMKDEEQANLKREAEIVQNMSAEEAAESLMEWLNEGKLETIVQLMHFIEPRNAAQILEQLDASPRQQILEAYKVSAAPLKKKRK